MNDKKGKDRKGLGRGLSALMADVNISAPDVTGEAPARATAETELPIELLRANPDQPRRQFDETHLESLTASVSEKGILQPLIVRPDPNSAGEYQIVAGERRWRAAQRARLHAVPVLIRELSDTEVLEVAIIENIQRADLNPVEEASGYRQLMDRFGHTQERLAEALGKSRSHIANMMRLLSLPEAALNYLRDGQLTAGHARALITSENPEKLAQKVVAEGLSVRETERLAKGPTPSAGATDTQRSPAPEKDADTRALEADLSATLGMKVTIDHSKTGPKGKLSIDYKDLDQLDDLCRLLSR
ncbi:ParB/RepB/Spo0J family partition protein [Tropicimonas sp. S265A]|uniref:ParB/RepB/Spo0J family partition protein n=1 Tax=Tropicimonas sp. S265A TaxID=3415134 RepID=UPI003C7D8A4B